MLRHLGHNFQTLNEFCLVPFEVWHCECVVKWAKPLPSYFLISNFCGVSVVMALPPTA